MTQITIPELNQSTVIPLNSLFPFENTLTNETKSTTFSTILSYVEPKTKLYLNNVLSGIYPAINLVSGNNISFNTSNNANYFNVEINSTIPSPLQVANVGTGLGLYKNFTSSYNFKSLVAGNNITLTPNLDSITIEVTNTGEINTISNVGTGVGLFKQKAGLNLEFKTLVAGANISFDTTNNNQIIINSTGGSGGSIGQNIGTGLGKVYATNVGSILSFKTIKAGSNITITDSLSEITISSSGGTGGTSNLQNTPDAGTKLLNTTGFLKTIVGGDGIIINDTETTLTLSTNTGNEFGNVGTGVTIYKGFNSTIDKHELKTIRSQDGIIVENLNANEILIKGNVTSSITSTNTTNTLISSQVGSTTTLKVLNTSDATVASITNNADNLTLSVLNNASKWNANKIDSIPLNLPNSPLSPEQESTLVYRGTEYVSGLPNSLVSKYLTGQLFGSLIPTNNQIFKIVGPNTWGLATPSDSTSPLINFLSFYSAGRMYTTGTMIDGLAGLVAGTVYYLNSSSTISTVVSSTIIGIALNTTTLWFKPYAT